jgi:Cd2+/Zn2+-exporting ATPase
MTDTPKTYLIDGMDCANCARELEDGVRKLEGVQGVRVDFATAKMRVEGDVPQEALRARVEALGKKIVGDADSVGAVREPAQNSARKATGGVIGFWHYLRGRGETRLALLGGVITLLALGGSLAGLYPVVVQGMYLLVLGVAGYPIARSGIRTLLINRDFNINLLMTIAAAGAVLIGETLEAATVIFLFAIGEALEGYTADRARQSLHSLMSLAPAQATRIQRAMLSTGKLISIGMPDREEIVPISELQVGDTLLIKAGERIAMDGVVTSGASGVNQAPITGESIPVHKQNGDEVFAGTINGEGVLHVRVTRRVEDNTLSRIIRMVEEAQSVRAPSQRAIDQFARSYTPAVVVVALVFGLIPPLLFNAPFYDTPTMQGWLHRALELLVIACPCALVISTPVTVISAITAAARRGVLIKGGAHLEALGRIKAIAFDKTGTLTRGEPTVTALRSVDCATGEQCEKCDDVLALASAVERRSTHPLAQAVVQAANARGVANTYVPAESVELLAGRGVRGQVNGRWVTVGSHSLFDQQYPHASLLCEWVDAAEAHGQTAMLLSDGERVRGFIAVADAPRDDSAAVIADLKSLGLKTLMLTGDNATVAQAVGSQVGVDDVRANLLPSDKVDAVNGLLAAYQQVAMVGDGVNDTPALATATIGVAMGGAGSAQALETADVALMADDLRQLPFAVRLSRFAGSLIRQNISISFAIKLLFIMLALLGVASLWAAVLADMGTSLLVTLNGMRPLRME